ncbi:MAG: hypothetical protein UHM52_01175 [Acutalibacteraceae bacterium]|nr:hypothetical protein [Acutalibacteraceae bacterium]
MKRNSILALLLCVLFVAVGTGCSLQKPGSQPDATKAQKTTKSAQIANPVKTYDSLAKAEKVAGFTFTVPEGVNLDGADYAQYYWSTINENLIEVRYGAEGDEVCYMRKAPASAADDDDVDISGDYNVYDTVKEVEFTLEDGREVEVILKGKDKKFYVANWQLKGVKDNGVWNYAIGVRGIPEQDLLELVKMVE